MTETPTERRRRRRGRLEMDDTPSGKKIATALIVRVILLAAIVAAILILRGM